MRYAVKVEVIVEASTDQAAAKAASEINAQLATPYLKALLAGRGVSLKGYRVDPKPTPDR